MSDLRKVRRDRRRHGLETLESRVVLAVDPIIAEFQAVNGSTLRDQDGETSDWIEVRNQDASPLNLDGWYLTDDVNDKTKWRFPAVTMRPGEQIVVFASGKDRTDAQNELHTNFQLSGDGEYLAIVRPDGVTVADAYDPYPAQFQDQSYGLAVERVPTQLLDLQSPVRAFVPTDDSLGLSWTQPGFNDASWQAGNGSVGFEFLEKGYETRDDFDPDLDEVWQTSIPAGSNATINIASGKVTLSTPPLHDLRYLERGLAPIVSRDLPAGIDGNWEISTFVELGANNRGAAGIAVLDRDSGTPVVQLEYSSQLNFRFTIGGKSQGTRTNINRSSFYLRLLRDVTEQSWSAYYKLDAADDWSLIKSSLDSSGLPMVENPQVGFYASTSTTPLEASFDYFAIQVPDAPEVYQPEIGLDVETSMHRKNSSVYLRYPFQVAGDPARLTELELTTRFDDGFRAYLNGVEVTSQNVPIDAEWNSTASTDYGAVNGNIPRDLIDISKFAKHLLPGNNVLAIHGMNVGVDDSDFFFEGTLLGNEILDSSLQYFESPTPGEKNSTPAAPPPIVIGEDGIFFGETTVSIQTPNDQPFWEIRYTVDGKEPTKASLLYTEPLVLTGSTMLQAKTFDSREVPKFDPSAAATGTYIGIGEDLRDRTSDIPIIILDTIGQGIPGSGASSMATVNAIAFEVSKATGRAAIDTNQVDYLGRGGIRDRGSSTAGQPKPNLAFETWGLGGSTQDDDESVALLGFKPESDWVLYAPYHWDRAMIRNQLAFELANGQGHWAPSTRAVEVFINRRDGTVSEADYFGVYILMEKIKQGPNRVDIADISPGDNAEPEISGGYIWKIDRADPGEPQFTAGGQTLNWVEPKSPGSRTASEEQRATDEQQRWVQEYFGKFQQALRDPDISDPEGYSQYIDINSWVDHHLLSVLADNVDALALSTYLFKDRGKKIEYGPQWDFDRAMESLDDRDDDPNRWGGSGGSDFFARNFYGSLFRDPGFWQAYVDRWSELRKTIFSDDNINSIIDRLTDTIEESAERNFEKWRASRPRTTSTFNSGALDGSFRGEVEHMREWLRQRLLFMDSNFVQPPSIVANDKFIDDQRGIRVAAGSTFEFKGPIAETFIDTPILPGEVGQTIAKYIPIGDNNLADTWTSPTFDDSTWKSGPVGLGFDTGSDYTDLIGTEVDPRVDFPGSTTILTRFAFEVSDLGVIQDQDLVLRMIYDDAFIAYLNGVRIADAGLTAGVDVSWDMRASSRGRDSEAKIPADFTINEFKNLLVQGTNVLSIRLINQSGTSNDMILVPELVARKTEIGPAHAEKIYYTTDGSDPRGPDGMPSPSAILATVGEKISVGRNMRLVTRHFDDVTYRGSEARIVRTDWSAPVELNFVVADTTLAISEVHYNPAGPTAAELVALPGVSSNDFEFVELYNWGTRAVDLNGVELTDGVEFDFFADANNSTLGSKQYGVLVANPAAFQLRYGNQVRVLGQFRGSLDNASEDIDLIDGTGAVVFSVNYRDNDLWGVAADGLGASLELKNPNLTPQAAQSKWYSWRSSGTPHGTPGAANSAPTGIVINEVIAHTEGNVQLTDSIELHNTTPQPINIGGWWLSDSGDEPFKYQIPAGTTIAAGGYTVFNESQFNAGNSATRFGLSASGDNVWLVQGTVAGGVTRFVDDVHFDATLNGESLGRMPNGSGRLAPLNRPSFGNVNTTPRVGPVVISEISYNPVLSAAALAADPTLEASDLEFIEIHNPTAAAVSLTNWRIRGGADYDFPAGTSLAAGQSLVVLKFDPDNPENVNQVAAFRAHYGIGEDVRLIGGYAGLLNNSDDRIELLRPDPSSPPDDLARVQEDEVLYDDLAPWPAGADGVGRNTLQRKTVSSFGNDGNNWTAGPGSPGSLLIPRVPGDSNGDGIFNSRDFIFVFLAGKYEDGIPNNATFEEGDWDGDGDFTSADFVYVFLNGDYSTEATPSQTTLQPLAVESLFREIPDVDDDRWLLDPLDDEEWS